MPYIPKHHRVVARENPIDVGELTFNIQQTLKQYLERRPGVAPRYADYAECFGALVCAGIDLAVRKLIPYEQAKQAENGDVW